MFDSDYDLSTLQLIESKGTGINFYVTSRYLHHYVQNEYEPFSIELLKNYLPQNGHFVDVGAHYGYYSLIASKFCHADITAVEAVPINFKILEKNLRYNNSKIKQLVHGVASNKLGKIKLNLTEASDSAGVYNHPLTKTRSTLRLKSYRLDDILDSQDIDFMKIDVEGHECPVMDGLKKTLRKNPKLKLLIVTSTPFTERVFFT